MKIPHFFKAKSRIGLKNIPIHQTELNLGVEYGPDAVLEDNFLKEFKDYQISEYIFSKPEDILNEDFDIVLANNLEAFKNQINSVISQQGAKGVIPAKAGIQESKKTWIPDHLPDSASLWQAGVRNDKIVQVVQVVIGGDHSVTFSSLLAVLNRINDPKDLGYIQFDSHGDMNLAKTSPTQNFHGMYLRPFLDKFDIPEVANLIKKKLKPENMLFIGNLDLDPKEREFFEGKKIRNIDREKLKTTHPSSGGQISKVKSDFKKFINLFKYLHISFDIDSLHKSIAPATGIPAENGLMKGDIFPFLEIISKHPNFSFDLCEVNPRKKGAEKTIKLAQEVLKIVLSDK